MKKNHLYSMLKIIVSLLLLCNCSKKDNRSEQDEHSLQVTNLKDTEVMGGLISWWQGSNDAMDAIGEHDGTLANGVTFSEGVLNEAFSFDGIDDYVTVPNDNDWNFGNSPFTIALWAKFNDLPNRAPLVDHNEGAGGTNKWTFWFDKWGHRPPYGSGLRFHINSPSLGALDPVVYLWEPEIGKWYHLAVTRDGSLYSIYIDGTQKITENDFHRIPDAIIPLSIGQSEFQYYFNGLIDEVKIFNLSLTSNQIAKVFAEGAAIKYKTITICHKPCTPAQKNMDIPIQALNGHLNHGDYLGPCVLCCIPTKNTEYILTCGPNPTDGIYVDDFLRVYINGFKVADINQMGHCCPPADPIHFIASSGDTLRIQAQDGNSCYSIDALWLQKANGSCLRQLTPEIYGPNCGYEPPEQVFLDQSFVLP